MTTDAAEAFVTDTISDKDQPVVLFALEWCEFCWAVRKLFAKLDIPYNAIERIGGQLTANSWVSYGRREASPESVEKVSRAVCIPTGPNIRSS